MSFVLSIEIYNGKEENLMINPEDNAIELSLAFIQKHCLPFQFHEQITKQISTCRKQIEEKLQEEKSQNSDFKKSYSRSHSPYNTVFERLYVDSHYRSQLRKESSEKSNIENKMKELGECTHKPIINPKSKTIANNNNNFKKLLYKNSIQKKRSYSMDSKFLENVPKINPLSNRICANTSFFQRQEHFNSIYEKRRQLKEMESFYDPETKNPLFYPKINSSLNLSRERSKSVFQSLYEEGASRKVKAAINEKFPKYDSSNSLNRKFISETSAAIVELMEKERIEDIFDILDYDENGYLDSRDLQFEKIDPIILELFWPLFLEIEERRISVTKSQFYEASMKLRNKWSIIQRDYIRRRRK